VVIVRTAPWAGHLQAHDEDGAKSLCGNRVISETATALTIVGSAVLVCMMRRCSLSSTSVTSEVDIDKSRSVDDDRDQKVPASRPYLPPSAAPVKA
jgi:hypothetical protein